MNNSEFKNEEVRVLNLSIKIDSKEQLQGILSGLELAMEAISNAESLNDAYCLINKTIRSSDDILKRMPESPRDILTKLKETTNETEKRYYRMRCSLAILKEALRGERIMNDSICKYQSLYSENTRLYQIDGILDHLRVIILDVKNNIEDDLFEFEVSNNITNKEDKQ
jgi:hypothetical protein